MVFERMGQLLAGTAAFAVGDVSGAETWKLC